MVWIIKIYEFLLRLANDINDSYDLFSYFWYTVLREFIASFAIGSSTLRETLWQKTSRIIWFDFKDMLTVTEFGKMMTNEGE